MERWNKKGIPHRGWKFEYIEYYEDDYEQCEMCDKEGVRFIHILSHPEYGEIRVGCDCACKMLNDYVNPQQREKDFKNKLSRLNNFLKIQWRYNPIKNTYSTRYKGEYITIIKSKYGNFGIAFQQETIWDYNGKKVRDLGIAKRWAFEVFDEKHKTLKERNLSRVFSGSRDEWIDD